MEKLTEEIIGQEFAKIGVKEEYKQYFSEKAMELYNGIKREELDCEDEEFEDVRTNISIENAGIYTKYYAEQREMGHGDLWARAYAIIARDYDNVDICIYNAADAIKPTEGKEIAEKEVELHLSALGKSPLFIGRYIYLLFRAGADYRELTESAQWYCDICNKLITEGKSETYAKAYAHMLDLDRDEHYCDIYAKIYAELIESGCDEQLARNKAENSADEFVE